MSGRYAGSESHLGPVKAACHERFPTILKLPKQSLQHCAIYVVCKASHSLGVLRDFSFASVSRVYVCLPARSALLYYTREPGLAKDAGFALLRLCQTAAKADGKPLLSTWELGRASRLVSKLKPPPASLCAGWQLTRRPGPLSMQLRGARGDDWPSDAPHRRQPACYSQRASRLSRRKTSPSR